METIGSVIEVSELKHGYRSSIDTVIGNNNRDVIVIKKDVYLTDEDWINIESITGEGKDIKKKMVQLIVDKDNLNNDLVVDLLLLSNNIFFVVNNDEDDDNFKYIISQLVEFKRFIIGDIESIYSDDDIQYQSELFTPMKKGGSNGNLLNNPRDVFDIYIVDVDNILKIN